MNWYVVRNPELKSAALVPETALDHHRARGWVRVSDAFSDLDREHVDVDLYRVDLDALETANRRALGQEPRLKSKEK
jgi:hypothetical protein